MHQYVEKLNHFFPATEASMFHVKHPPPTRKTKTQNTTPTHNKKQPTFHVKHREAFNHQKTRLQTQKISFTSITHVSRETPAIPNHTTSPKAQCSLFNVPTHG